MHPVLLKTFGGLTKAYYFRQLFFALIFVALFIFMFQQSPSGVPISVYIFLIVSSLLYPYSRFVYESVVGFVVGDNVFFVNVIFMLVVKYFTMALCFVLALFIAPIGLAYLYYHHSK